MKPFIKRAIPAMLLSMIAFSAAAHEGRSVAGGALQIEVGWRTEPAIEDVLNNFDLFVERDDGTPVSVRAGAEIDLSIEVLFLRRDTPSSPILAHETLEGELKQDFVNPSRYNIPFIPTKDGAYGFHLTGTIEGHPIDEVFICGGGSQSDDEAFDCVDDAQSFPFGTRARYRDN